mgnify:CR=1 FL=1
MAWYDPTSWFSDSTPVADYSNPSVLETVFGENYKPGGATVYGDQVLKAELPDGSIAYSNGIVMKPNGDVIVNGEVFGNTNTDGSGTLDTSLAGSLGAALSQFGTNALSGLKSLVTDSKGNINAAKLAGIAGGIMSGTGLGGNFFQQAQQPVGFTGGIPSYTAVREQVPQTYDPNRRPGSRGQEYFTDVQYAKPDQVATAKATAAQQATEAEARNKARTAETPAPRQAYAAGGIANLAQGRYLAGATDGMADKIPATIANQQPAKLSHGEFVIPADVVSHLGNGNSEAGANRLYGMMDKVRKARTGTTKQGKQINPNKYMPG